ncbi:MAG: tetratricopeptide repeat protein [Akkermansia sp.]|nr:tetratricopeptide repeat protein [Akkermansia sp.]
MKKHYLYSSLATAALAFAACSSLPKLPANLQAGVDANNPEAFYKAGQYYDNLENASNSSKWAKSAELYRKGAELGDAGCQFKLGCAYQKGAGVPRDYGQSRAWYAKAAEHNNADALYGLGYLYDEGLGVPRNYAVAKDYFERSKALGSRAAVNDLGLMYDKGHGVRVDKAKALKLYEQAAAMGSVSAKSNATALRREMAMQSPASAAHKVFVMKYYTPRMVETAAETSVGPGNYTYTIGMVSDSCRADTFAECSYRKTGPKTAQIKISNPQFEGVQSWREIHLTFTSPNSGEMKMEFYGYNPHAENPHGSCMGTVYGTFEISGSTNRNFCIPEQD